MKNTILIALLLGLSFNLLAQKVIDKPFVEATTVNYLTIEKITITSEATLLDCRLKVQKGSWFSLPKGTYIQGVDSEEKLHVLSVSEPYYLSKRIMPEKTETISFTMTFPAIDPNTKSINYIEGNKGGTWKMYGIALTNDPIMDYLPNEYYGSWLLADGSNQWHVSFLKDVVVYQGKTYTDFECVPKKDRFLLSLYSTMAEVEKNNTKMIDAFILEFEDGKLYIGKDNGKLQPCIKKKKYVAEYVPPVETLPEMKFAMDTAIFSGVLSNYSPKVGKTGTVYVNNVMTGVQAPNLLKINSDGTFSVKIPLYYPQSVYVRFPAGSVSPILVPGKETKLLLNGGDVHYLGDNAELNTIFNKMKYFRSFDYTKVRKEIEKMTPADYKEFCLEAYEKDKEKLSKQVTKFKVSPEIKRLAEQCIQLDYTMRVLEYDMKMGSVVYKYKKEGKKFDYESPSEDYYTEVLKQLPLDNAQLMMYGSYSSFVNRLKFLDFFRQETGKAITINDVAEYLESVGESIPADQQKVLDNYEAYKALDWVKEKDALYASQKEERSDFIMKYMTQYRSFSASYEGNRRYTDFKLALEQDTSVELSSEEIELLDVMATYETDEYIAKEEESFDRDAYKELLGEYKETISMLYSVQRLDYRNHKIDSIFGDDLAFVADIMNSQDLCPSSRKPTPLPEGEIKLVKAKIATPEVRDYVFIANEQAIAKIEANKYATGYNVNKVPETEGEKLFAEMIKPFAGKVVYVDFWATWCGPCLGGMNSIKPIKAELKDRDDIVFLYITGNSSPEKTWNAMVPDIKGEHYRLSKDEWNYICSQFGVSGIPHYMIVDKKGVVVNNNNNIRAGHGIKEKLLKYADE